MSIERQQRLVRTVAAALGAEMQEDSSSSYEEGPVVYDQYDLSNLPIGLGYESIE